MLTHVYYYGVSWERFLITNSHFSFWLSKDIRPYSGYDLRITMSEDRVCLDSQCVRSKGKLVAYAQEGLCCRTKELVLTHRYQERNSDTILTAVTGHSFWNGSTLCIDILPNSLRLRRQGLKRSVAKWMSSGSPCMSAANLHSTLVEHEDFALWTENWGLRRRWGIVYSGNVFRNAGAVILSRSCSKWLVKLAVALYRLQ